jgi:hypothetical protein
LGLSGLKTVGQQVTGGGFGDIWKGFVRGQSVCIKIMRIFEDSNVEAVLKVCLSHNLHRVLLSISRNLGEKPLFGANFVTQTYFLSSVYTI